MGYPISHRFMWRGFVTQAFQKAIFQWQPGRGVFFVNIFDELHDAGSDDYVAGKTIHTVSVTTFILYFVDAVGKQDTQEEVHRRRLALLDANPAIKKRYYAAPEPLLLYGLPTSRVEGPRQCVRDSHTAGGIPAMERRRALG